VDININLSGSTPVIFSQGVTNFSIENLFKKIEVKNDDKLIPLPKGTLYCSIELHASAHSLDSNLCKTEFCRD
jgi:hypothetical protein